VHVDVDAAQQLDRGDQDAGRDELRAERSGAAGAARPGQRADDDLVGEGAAVLAHAAVEWAVPYVSGGDWSALIS
jgi:hypothetical protein